MNTLIIYDSQFGNTERIAQAIEGRQKLLLTATPLQNSLMELYGLVSILDPDVFGSLESFQDIFVSANDEDCFSKTFTDLEFR